MNFRQKFCNALAVEHKYSNSFPINGAHNYKRRKVTEVKGTHKILYDNHSPINSL